MDYSLTPRMFIYAIFLLFLCFNTLEGGGSMTSTGEKDIGVENGQTEDEGFYEFQMDNEEEYVNIRIFVKTEGRNALKDTARLWMDGIIPFKISDKFGAREKRTTLLAMRDFMTKTCIRFVPVLDDTTAFIYIEPGIGCRASVGKLLAGKVSLDRSCNKKGIIMHELMHILGFHHEHNRPDRDEYVKINWENIKEDAYHNFWKLPDDLVQTANVSYDYDSIMHYRWNSFSKDRSIPTIITLKKKTMIGQRKGLSEGDILKIAKLYNCTLDVGKTRENNLKTKKTAAIMGDAYKFWKSAYMKNQKRFKRTADLQSQTDRYYAKSDDSETPVVTDKTAEESPQDYENRLHQWRTQYLYWWNHYHGWVNDHNVSKKPQFDGRKGRQVSYPATEMSPVYFATTKKKNPCENCTIPIIPEKTTVPVTVITEKLKITTASTIKLSRPPKITIPTTKSYNTPEIKIEPPKEITTNSEALLTEELKIQTPSPTTIKPLEKVPIISATVTTEQMLKITPAPLMRTPSTEPEVTIKPPKELTTTPVTLLTEKFDKNTPCSKSETTPCGKPLVTTAIRKDPEVTRGLTTDPVEFIAECPNRGKKSPCVPTTKREEKPKHVTDILTTVKFMRTEQPNPGTKASLLVEATTKPSPIESRRHKETFELACEPSQHPSPFHIIRIYHPILESRTALKDSKRLWKDARIPYELSDKYNDDQKHAILKAMAEFKNKTCVRFVERDEEDVYIFIEPMAKCSSVIGQSVKNVSQVLIGEGCYESATILHELMHVCGFIHEQNRPDRDQYVQVMWDNIEEGAEKNFEKYSTDIVTTLDSDYNYNSLMHYDAYAFAKNDSLPTLVPLKPGAKLGNTKGFSKEDIKRINKLYKCPKNTEMSDDHVGEASVIQNFKKYLESNFKRLFRTIMRTIQKFKAIRLN